MKTILGNVAKHPGMVFKFGLFSKETKFKDLIWQIESGILDSDNVDLTPGGCYLRTAWNFSNSTNSSKYSDQQQIYVPDRYNYALAGDGDDGLSHTWYKHRVRGRGNVLQLIIENEDDKDFALVGFTQQFYGVL